MLQITFEDLEIISKLSKQSGRTAFIDESGCFGFDFSNKGTSRYYIISAVIIKNDDIESIQKCVDNIRKKYFGTGEMKSSSIENRKRLNIIAEILPLNFKIFLLVADKQAFHDQKPLKEYKKSFIKYLHKVLYDCMYKLYPKLKIIEDETGSKEFQKGFKKYIENQRKELNLFDEYDFDFIDSRSNSLVQLADIISGSIAKAYTDLCATNYREILRGKILHIENFPNKNLLNSNNIMIMDPRFNKDIYLLADRCANHYINKHYKEDDIEKRMQVAFLRHLLFELNIDAYTYISSHQIVSILSDYSDLKISRDFFYRRIIAPLRDAGVIIASCPQGYKIPTCIEDIRKYLHQTDTVISPMLQRIGKCRDLIMQYTDNAIDILDDNDFNKYRNYFD